MTFHTLLSPHRLLCSTDPKLDSHVQPNAHSGVLKHTLLDLTALLMVMLRSLD